MNLRERFRRWIKMIPGEPVALATEAPLAKTIPDEWKQPIMAVVQPQLTDLQNQISALRSPPATVEVSVGGNADSTAASSLTALAASRLAAAAVTRPARVQRAPIFATGDLTGDNLVSIMKE